MAESFPHNKKYRLPFPSLVVQLRSPGTDTSSGEVPALVDTGADITSVPVRLLERIQAAEMDEVRLRSHWGHAVTVVTYLVDIALGDVTLPGVEVAGDMANQEIVLGRDVVNRLILLIDGPLSTTSVLEKPPRAGSKR